MEAKKPCQICKNKRGIWIDRIKISDDKEIKGFEEPTTSIVDLFMCEECGTIRGEHV